jgi:hypothetical protein
MAITFKWSVNKVQVAKDNLIVKVDLTVTGTDGEITASADHTRNLIRNDSFVPYDQLVEQQVIDWCFEPETITLKSYGGKEYSVIKHLQVEGEAQITGKIERLLAQKAVEPDLPWKN